MGTRRRLKVASRTVAMAGVCIGVSKTMAIVQRLLLEVRQDHARPSPARAELLRTSEL